ncbi:methylenetetrahydrofolate reductase [Actinacidiphila oryziradicis]|uniref:Methylenetetrahydrofolate reductase n=1 Tax=Actinacidiphila oryziradicis TaxID=2571141 RepID=A0A4U0T7Q4_9ACTN|nr:methylenetetrahydrofolate reductase [Actinacidiphila oryziradicis]TKA09485.1 5,10-methylenetetrahydrofolate reductase [Actinacidiphila oryziradicis]
MSYGEREDVRGAVAALATGANVEVIPLRGVEQKLSEIPINTTVTVTCSPKFGLDRTLDYAELAVKTGHRVVPHLAARQVADKAELLGFVRRLDALGVKDLYVIGGDAATPAGDYTSAAELIEALGAIDHGLERIGVACYPEGHPKIADNELLDALRRKQPHAHYMVSQLCFDVDTLVSWLRRMRSAGIELPLRLGLAAPMNILKLTELSIKIGVGSSVRFLTKQHGLVGSLLRGSSYQPEELLYRIGAELTSDELRIEGLHLFSFNQISATVGWQQRVGGAATVQRI